MGKVDRGALRPGRSGMTVDQLLDLFLDGIDADQRLGAKTRFDYRHYAGRLRAAAPRRGPGP